MGCGDACPFVPGLKKIDWDLRDPKNQSIVVVRQIRDQIYQQVFQLISERNWAKS
jgi:arsenate reductase (thioredoxin)